MSPAGCAGIYLYPPPFAIVVVPFALLPPDLALWAWTALLVAAFVGGSLVLPVRPTIRWLVVLLGGLMWPFLYSVKLGQVGPLLYLAFAIGWRWLDGPADSARRSPPGRSSSSSRPCSSAGHASAAALGRDRGGHRRGRRLRDDRPDGRCGRLLGALLTRVNSAP